MEKKMMPLSAKNTYEALKQSGYTKSLIGKFLPDWWDDALLKTSAGSFQFAAILKQRIGLSVNFEANGELTVVPNNPLSRFKHRVDTTAQELSISANLGRAIGQLALHASAYAYTPPPSDPQELRSQVLAISGKQYVDFPSLLNFCWVSGIPVLFLDNIPKPFKRMAGMVSRIGDRPVIILGYKNQHHARQLFVLSHEIGHLQSGHIQNNETLIDEDLVDITDKIGSGSKDRQDKEEKEADAFGLGIIRGKQSNFLSEFGRISSPASLAARSIQLSQSIGVDPGHMLLSFAYEHNEWATVNQAMNFLPNSNNALEVLQKEFTSNTNLLKLSEENREHLLTMQGIAT